MDFENELSDNELEGVSGGREVILPSTHEEIDQVWDAIQAAADSVDIVTATIMAYDMRLIPFMDISGENYFDSVQSIDSARYWMHEALNRKMGS